MSTTPYPFLTRTIGLLLAGGALHPYTRALAESVPDLTADRGRPLPTVPGDPPDPLTSVPGCAFEPRCPRRRDRCAREAPPLGDVDEVHQLACWYPGLAS